MDIAPVGLLVIRAWLQEGSERPLRVEVRMTADTGRGFEPALAFTEPGPVEALVRAWLAEVLADAGLDGTSGDRRRTGLCTVLIRGVAIPLSASRQRACRK
jgi:hypothetical protein